MTDEADMMALTTLLATLLLAALGADAQADDLRMADRGTTAETPSEASTHDGDPERGAAMAPLCESCHGPDGRSRTSRFPSIAGLPEGRIVERLKAFRAGESSHLMESMTRGLSDQDIADLAAYFSRLE